MAWSKLFCHGYLDEDRANDDVNTTLRQRLGIFYKIQNVSARSSCTRDV